MKVGDQLATVIALGTTNGHIMAQRRFERAPFLCRGTLYANGSALGLTAELNVGGRSVSPATDVNAQNRLPVVPDDLLFAEWIAYPGEQIQITVANPTAGNLTFFWKIELEELEVQQ